jgi:hypothetical protein
MQNGLGRGGALVAGDDPQAIPAGQPDHPLEFGMVDQGVEYLRALIHGQRHSHLPLRIEIDDDDFLAFEGQAVGQVDDGGGLADAALLTGDGNHGWGHGELLLDKIMPVKGSGLSCSKT